MAWSNNNAVAVPDTYVTSRDSPIQITNYPESGAGATPIQVVALNRPEKLNAFTGGMINDLIQFITTVEVDERVKVIVLTGKGKAFSAGIDLNSDTSSLKNDTAVANVRDPGGTLALAMYNSSKVIIVAYNGLSVGIGMTSKLAAAIRIAPAKAEFGFPFARIGISMESCSSFFLPRMVGYSNATYLLATGRRYPADSKVLDGVFAELVAQPKDVLPRALETAQDILDNVSTMAIHVNRQLIWRNEGSAEAAHLVDSPVLIDMFGSSDHQEFKKAFFAKRNPNFTDTISKNAPRTYPWWREISVMSQPTAALSSKAKL